MATSKQFLHPIALREATTGSLNVTGSSVLQGGVTTGSVKVSGSILQIPVGTSLLRPINATQGCVRFNTDTQQFEGFGAGNQWGSLGGVVDSNGDTTILAEASAGANDDNLRFLTAGVERMRLNSAGNVGIGTSSPGYKLHVSGDIYANGDVIALSDRRFKTDVVTVEDALQKVRQMRGVYYKNVLKGNRSVGVIAQELEEILPEVVIDKGNYKGVAYGNIVGVLIEAIKELHHNVDELYDIVNGMLQR